MMNIFRLAGDMSHVISIMVLLLRLRVSKNAVGISMKTQELYLLNTEPFKSNYEKAHDSFLHWQFAVLPCVVIAIITNLLQGFDLMELLWTFSIYLEAIAIVPQLIVLQRYRDVENLNGHYVFFLGAYRFLYILNWQVSWWQVLITNDFHLTENRTLFLILLKVDHKIKVSLSSVVILAAQAAKEHREVVTLVIDREYLNVQLEEEVIMRIVGPYIASAFSDISEPSTA
eukprot:gene1239-2406_t